MGAASRRAWTVLFVAILVGVPSTAVAQDAPPEPSPIDVDPSQDELDYYNSIVSCPVVDPYRLVPSTVSSSGLDFRLFCEYDNPENTGDAGTVRLIWARPGSRSACTITPLGGDRQGAISGGEGPAPFAAGVQYSWGEGVDENLFLDVATELLANVRPLATGCPAPAAVTCPSLAGYETPDDPRVASDDGYTLFCSYRADELPAIDLNARWNVDFLGGEDVLTWLCSDVDRSADSYGQVTADGVAALVLYWVGSSTPIDLTGVTAAAEQMLDEAATQAQSCDGVELIDPESVFTPLPDYLANAFSSIGTTTRGSAAEADEASDGSEPTESAPPSDEGTADEVAVAPSPGSGDPGAPSVDDGDNVWLRVVTVALLIISLVGVVVSFVLVRRPSRIRPILDIVRITTMVTVAVLSVVVLGRSAPVVAVAGAVLIGGALGIVQGRGLTVSVGEKGLYGKRSGISIVAFGVGVVVLQLAGLAQREGLLDVGIAVSALAAAIAAGLYLARRSKLRLGPINAVGVGLLFALSLGLITSLPGGDANAQEADHVAVANAALVEAVDWDSIQLHGGLYGLFHGKPPAEMSVPAGFTGIPGPVSRTVAWTVEDAAGLSLVSDGTTYEVTETFTFSARDDGLCCSVDYVGAGTRRIPGQSADEAQVLEADARLDDIQAWVIDGEPGSFRFGSDLRRPPFAEVEELVPGLPGDDCGRRVAAERSGRDLEESNGRGEFRSASRNGEAVDSVNVAPIVLAASCELDGYSVEAALALAPPPPEVTATGCPTRQELFGTLDGLSSFGGVDTETLNKLYFEPNDARCDHAGLINPLAFGQGGPGNTRHELLIDFVQPSDGAWNPGFNRWFTGDRVLAFTAPRPLAKSLTVCDVGVDGVAVDPGVDDPCVTQTVHRLGAPGDHLYVTVDVDYSYFDGPNTDVWVRAQWGTYVYRCHHCTPGDPEIASFLEGLNEFGARWAAERFADGEIGAAPGSVEEATLAEGAAAAAVGGGSPADDISEEEAALVALLGALGVSAVAITTFVERGGRLEDLVEAAGAGTSTGVAVPSVTDEFGQPIYEGEDGLYEWEGDRLSRDEVTERIAREQEAAAQRAAEHEAFVDAHMTEAGVEERFDRMETLRTDRNNAAMAEIRDGWTSIAERQDRLDRRAAAAAQLELLEADHELAHSMSSWDQILRDTLERGGREVAALPGEIVDGVRQVTRAVADPENWRVAGETFAETAYDLAGMTIGGGTFGDAHQSIANGTRTAAQVGWVMVTNPVDTAIMLSPLQNFSDAVDGERTLGGRLVALGMGLVDVAGTLAGAGVLAVGDDLARAGRAADAATQAAHTMDATADAAAAARAASAGGDAGLGAARVVDGALSPELLAARDQIHRAVLRAQQEAAWRGVPVADVLRDLPEARALFQDGLGMGRMGALEAAGGLSDEVAGAVVAMHDEITGAASRAGVGGAVETMAQRRGIRPQQVLVGNSGSVGASRSVVTDADRTLITVFSDDDIATVMRTDGLASPAEAAERLQSEFASFHQNHMELGLNPRTDPAVILAREEGLTLSEAVARLDAAGTDDPAAAALRLTRDQMDHASYGGMGSLSGQSDSYPAGFTQSRQSLQGSTEVMTVHPDGSLSSYSTSGQALIDQQELERFRHTGSVSMVDVGGGSAEVLWHDPTRIPADELPELLRQQVQAVEKYDDVKSVAKAVDRAEYVAARTGSPLADPALVEASVAIRADPRSTAAVLGQLGMTEAEFVSATRTMLLDYGAGAS